jgi:hypothetical protein
MATEVECPSCHRSLSVPEEMFGTRVKCPDCGDIFEAGPAGLRAALPDAFQPETNGEVVVAAPPPGTPFAVTPVAGAPRPGPAGGAADMRPCPFCAEPISTNSFRCPFCSEDMAEEDDRPWERPYGARVRRDSLPHRGTMILVFGILSFVLPYVVGMAFGLAAWIMGHIDLRRMKAGEMDPEGTSLTKAGWICGIIGTLFQGMLTLVMVGWIGFMIFAMSTMAPPPPPPMKAPPAPVPVQPVVPVQPPGPGQRPAEMPPDGQ